MISLSAKIRQALGKKVKKLRKKGILPAILYGPKIKNLALEIDLKEFEKIYKEAGKSTLISLKIEDQKQKFLVLIYDVKLNSLTLQPIHVDFFQPELEEEVKVMIPLIFKGESLAVKNLGGILIKNISEIEVKAQPQNLPSVIKVDISKLKTFDDNILVKDLIIPKKVKIFKEPEEIIASILPPKEKEEKEEEKKEEEEKELK